MTEPTDPIAFVRYYNAWRIGGDMDQPEPSTITRMLTELCDHAEQLERELAAERALPANLLDVHAICDQRDKAVEDLQRERELADRLAGTLRQIADGCNDAWCRDDADKALSAWKEARRDT